MHSDTLIQFIKFGIVGLSNTLLGYVIYVVTLRILRAAQVFPEGLAACAAEDLCFLCLYKSVFK